MKNYYLLTAMSTPRSQMCEPRTALLGRGKMRGHPVFAEAMPAPGKSPGTNLNHAAGTTTNHRTAKRLHTMRTGLARGERPQNAALGPNRPQRGQPLNSMARGTGP